MKHLGWNRLLAVLAALVVLAVTPAAALADAAVVNELYLGRYSITLNDATNTYTARTNTGYALFDAQGNQLSEAYGTVSSRNGGVYSRVNNDNSLNNYGMLDAAGKLFMPMAYGDIDIISDNWVLAYVLEPTTDTNGDYHDSSNNQYNITTVDVYFKGEKIGSLTREDLPKSRSVGAHGDYLYVKQTDRKSFYLSGAFVRVDYESEDYVSVYSEYDEVYRKGIFHRPTNQQVFVSGCTLTPDEVEQSVHYDDKGNFIDLQGNLISQGKTPGQEYNYVSYRGDYFYTTSNDGHGLTKADGTEVVEPVYSDIGGSEGDYFASGYQVVAKDGVVMYLDMAGRVTATIEYPLQAGDYRGFYNNAPFLTYENMGQQIVFTAEKGELAQRYEDAGYPHAGQRVLAVKLNDAWGVIDLQGNTVIPFVFRYSPSISDDGTLVTGSTDDGYVLYTIAYTESAAPAVDAPAVQQPADETWVCPTCGDTNATKFCPNDGTPRPEEETIPTCGNCGYQPSDGVAPKFCPECGTAFN